jgi:hypothetical protein
MSPAADRDLTAVERVLRTALPEPLRAFFSGGSAGLDCGYTFEPEGDSLDQLREIFPDERRIYGGPRLGPLSELPDLSSSVAEWANETWVADDPEQRVIWESALPFLQLANGDFLALDLRAGHTNPPVVYLNHDDESVAISTNFGRFLAAWERLCYIGPEHWLLLEFRGADGHIDASGDRAVWLRRLLTA